LNNFSLKYKNWTAGTTFYTKAQGMRIQINIGLGIGIIFIFYTKPSHDWIIFNLILANIISTFTAFPSRPQTLRKNTLWLKTQWMRNYWRIAKVMPSSLGFEMKPFHGGILKILILRKIIFAKKLAIYLTSKN